MNEAPIPTPIEEDPVIEVPMSSWESWKKAPSPAAMSTAIKSIDPVISSAVRRHPGINENLLMGEAKRLAVQAIKSFDPVQGTSLSTHVFNHLRPLSRFAERATKAVSVPRDFKAEVGGFVKARRDFEEENGREASDGEMRDILGINAKRLAKLNAGTFYEMPEGQIEGAVEQEDDESPKLNLWADYVYHDLSPRDKLIMDYRMGRNGKPIKEPQEIAAILKMDPSHVRKRTKSIAQQILDGLDSSSLNGNA
jgi:DNA-directed RNA polymerase specialized sigma subunit